MINPTHFPVGAWMAVVFQGHGCVFLALGHASTDDSREWRNNHRSEHVEFLGRNCGQVQIAQCWLKGVSELGSKSEGGSHLVPSARKVFRKRYNTWFSLREGLDDALPAYLRWFTLEIYKSWGHCIIRKLLALLTPRLRHRSEHCPNRALFTITNGHGK